MNTYLSPLVQFAQSIQAMDYNANYDQADWRWGEDGTEAGHTWREAAHTSTNPYTASGETHILLRFVVEQDQGLADLLLTLKPKVQYRIDTGTGFGSWSDIPTSAGTNPVYIKDSSNLTQGDDTTQRLTVNTYTFISDNNCVLDTADEPSSAITFTADSTQEINVLISLAFQAAYNSSGYAYEFRVVHGSGSSQAEDTVLNTYTNGVATATWSTPVAVDQADFRVRSGGGHHDANGVALSSDTGWAAAVNTNPTSYDPLDQEIRIRFNLENTGGSAGAKQFELWYAKDTGGGYGSWAVVPNVTTPWTAGVNQREVGLSPSDQFLNHASITAGLLGGTGTWVNGEGVEAEPTNSITLGANTRTELEFCILIRHVSNYGNLSAGDKVKFQVRYSDGTQLDSYTNTPEITISGTRGILGGSTPETPNRWGAVDDEGNIYAIVEYSDYSTGTFINEMALQKSTDGGLSWQIMDEANRPSSTPDIESVDIEFVASDPDGDPALYISYYYNDDVYFIKFWTAGATTNSPDTWDTAVLVDNTPVPPGPQNCSIAYRPGGTPTIWISYGTDDGSAHARVGLKKSTNDGVSWDSSPTMLDETTSTNHYTAASMAMDASGVIHIIYQEGDGSTTTSGVIWHKSISTGDSLSSRTQVNDAAHYPSGADEYADGMWFTPPVVYNDGATERIAVVFKAFSGGALWYTQSPTSSISFGTDEQVNDGGTPDDGRGGSSQVVAGLAIDDTNDKMYVAWGDTNLLRDVRVSGSWGTDSTEITATDAINWVRTIVYTRSGSIYLGIFYDDHPDAGGCGGCAYKEIYLASAGGATYYKYVDFSAAIQKTQSKAVNIDAAIRGTLTKNLNIDAAVLGTLLKNVDIDAAILGTLTKTTDFDAAVAEILTKVVDFDSAVLGVLTKAVDLDAAISQLGLTKTLNIDAGVQQIGNVKNIDFDAAIATQYTKTMDLDAAIQGVLTKAINLDAAIKAFGLTKNINFDAAVVNTYAKNVDLDAVVSLIVGLTVSLDVAIQKLGYTKTTDLDAAVSLITQLTVNLDSAIKALGIQKVVDFDAAVSLIGAKNVNLDAAVVNTYMKLVNLDVAVQSLGITKFIDFDAAVKKLGLTKTVDFDASVVTSLVTYYKYVDVDAAVSLIVQKLVNMDAAIRGTLSKAVNLDVAIQDTFFKDLDIDAAIQRLNFSLNIDFDAGVAERLSKVVSLDSAIKGTLSKSVLFDAKVGDEPLGPSGAWGALPPEIKYVH